MQRESNNVSPLAFSYLPEAATDLQSVKIVTDDPLPGHMHKRKSGLCAKGQPRSPVLSRNLFHLPVYSSNLLDVFLLQLVRVIPALPHTQIAAQRLSAPTCCAR
jgi:hypothetical protein